MELYYVVMVVAFIAGLLAVEALYGMWNVNRGPEARRVSQRLRIMSAGGHAQEELDVLKKRDISKLPTLERWLLSLPRFDQLDRLLVQSGLNLSVSSFLLWEIAFVVLFGWVAWWFTGMLWFAITIAALFAAFPFLYVVRAKFKRQYALLLQLPDALGLISRALRAGHAFSGGLKMVGDEMPDPIATEFRTTFDELNFGLSLNEAMMNLARRVDIPDVRYFVIAVLIQRESGGNLAEVFDKIAEIIRERLRLLGRVRVLSAQGRMEAWIMTILPFVVAGIMFTLWPQFMSILWKEEAGRALLAVAAVMMILGIIVMWRMIRIRI